MSTHKLFYEVLIPQIVSRWKVLNTTDIPPTNLTHLASSLTSTFSYKIAAIDDSVIATAVKNELRDCQITDNSTDVLNCGARRPTSFRSSNVVTYEMREYSDGLIYAKDSAAEVLENRKLRIRSGNSFGTFDNARMFASSLGMDTLHADTALSTNVAGHKFSFGAQSSVDTFLVNKDNSANTITHYRTTTNKEIIHNTVVATPLPEWPSVIVYHVESLSASSTKPANLSLGSTISIPEDSVFLSHGTGSQTITRSNGTSIDYTTATSSSRSDRCIENTVISLIILHGTASTTQSSTTTDRNDLTRVSSLEYTAISRDEPGQRYGDTTTYKFRASAYIVDIFASSIDVEQPSSTCTNIMKAFVNTVTNKRYRWSVGGYPLTNGATLAGVFPLHYYRENVGDNYSIAYYDIVTESLTIDAGINGLDAKNKTHIIMYLDRSSSNINLSNYSGKAPVPSITQVDILAMPDASRNNKFVFDSIKYYLANDVVFENAARLHKCAMVMEPSSTASDKHLLTLTAINQTLSKSMYSLRASTSIVENLMNSWEDGLDRIMGCNYPALYDVLDPDHSASGCSTIEYTICDTLWVIPAILLTNPDVGAALLTRRFKIISDKLRVTDLYTNTTDQYMIDKPSNDEVSPNQLLLMALHIIHVWNYFRATGNRHWVNNECRFMIRKFIKYIGHAFVQNVSPKSLVTYWSLDGFKGFNDTTLNRSNFLLTYLCLWALDIARQHSYETYNVTLGDTFSDFNDIVDGYVQLPMKEVGGALTIITDMGTLEALDAVKPLTTTNLPKMKYLEPLVVLHPYYNEFLMGRPIKVYVNDTNQPISLNTRRHFSIKDYESNVALYSTRVDETVTSRNSGIFNDMIISTCKISSGVHLGNRDATGVGFSKMIEMINNFGVQPTYVWSTNYYENLVHSAMFVLLNIQAIAGIRIRGGTSSNFTKYHTYTVSGVGRVNKLLPVYVNAVHASVGTVDTGIYYLIT